MPTFYRHPHIYPASRPGGSPSPAGLLDQSIKIALHHDKRDASLWLPGPALERLRLGFVDGLSPFDHCFYAVDEKRADALDVLLDLGYAPCPQPDGAAQAGRVWSRLLQSCAEHGLCGAIERLARTMPIDTPSRHGWTPLISAAANGEEEAALLLLRLGADPFATTTHGESAIMVAAMLDLPLLARALLLVGADPHEPDPQGLSAMAHARESAPPSHRVLAAIEAFEIDGVAVLAPSRPRPSL